MRGYLVDVSWDGRVLRASTRVRLVSVALQGRNRGEDVVVTREHIASVAFKPASALVNGKVTVTTVQGARYQLHFRRKQQAGMDELAVALQTQQSGPASG